MVQEVLHLRAVQTLLDALLPLCESGRVFRAFPMKGTAFVRIFGQAGGETQA